MWVSSDIIQYNGTTVVGGSSGDTPIGSPVANATRGIFFGEYSHQESCCWQVLRSKNPRIENISNVKSDRKSSGWKASKQKVPRSEETEITNIVHDKHNNW